MGILSILSAINQSTAPLIYGAILLNFIILVFLVAFNSKHILVFLKKIDRKTWLTLGAISAIALALRIILAPHQHSLYVDEAWYMEAGKNMLENSTIGNYSKSIGWPFVLRILFGIFGLSNWVALYASTALGALSVVPMFLVAFALTKKKELSLGAALIFSLFPISVLWSGSAETNVPSMFFLLLAVFFSLIYYVNKEKGLLLLASAAITFAAQFRPEFYCLFILFVIGYFLNPEKGAKLSGIALDMCLFFIIALVAIPNMVNVVSFYGSIDFIASDSFGQETGSNWSLSNLVTNTRAYWPELFGGVYQPVILLPFLAMGVIYMLLKRRKELIFLASCFVMLWLFYFTSWFQTLGGRERSYISFYWMLAIFAAYGAYWISILISGRLCKAQHEKKIFLAVILILSACFIPLLGNSEIITGTDSRLLETKIPELAEKDIPSDCTVISNWPTVLASTTNINLIDVKDFLCDSNQEVILENNSCVLFFDDLLCYSPNPRISAICAEMRQRFSMETYKAYSLDNTTFTFYRLTERKMDLEQDNILAELDICLKEYPNNESE